MSLSECSCTNCLCVSVLGRMFIGPASQTLMQTISSVKVDKTDYSCVETAFPECALIAYFCV